jgi:hypothetical protein
MLGKLIKITRLLEASDNTDKLGLRQMIAESNAKTLPKRDRQRYKALLVCMQRNRSSA